MIFTLDFFLGSVLHTKGDLDEVFARSRKASSEEDKAEILKELGLRYFSPKEIGKLMGYPQNLTFPEDSTLLQKYRCLGNSLNVQVVCFLLKLLFRND